MSFRIILNIFCVVGFLGLVSCSSKLYEGDMKLAESVDLERFMGTWYVIANIPTIFEKDCTGAIDHYEQKNEDRIDVTYVCFKNSVEGKRITKDLKAWVLKPNEWRVQFFWPLKVSYLILDVSPDYQWTVIGHPSKDYVWIMSREPQMSSKVLSERKQFLREQGYDISELVMTPQHTDKITWPPFSLKDAQWKKRILYVGGSDSERVETQREQFLKEGEARDERKLELVKSDQLSSAERKELSLNDKSDFELVLIGLDGGVKFRSQAPVSPEEIFSLIDSMPMRANELKSNP